MKFNNKYIALVIGLMLSFTACETEEDLIADREADNELPGQAPELTGSAGTADFSNYVAIGNSLTAGFMDAALYNRGQQNSFPNLLAGRFSLAGGGEFNLPDIDAENGFNASLNDLTMAFDQSAAIFGRFFLDLSIPGPSPYIGGDALTMFSDPASVNNLGVPGMRLIELTTDNYGMLNPFYTRFALNPASTSMLQQALTKQPTFMTFWLGNNDVLKWATGGGVGEDGESNPALDAIPSTLVSTTSFNAVIDGSMAAMFGTNPDLKGVILNIPNVTLIPFFQAVKWNAIPLDQATADAVNAGYAGYNALVMALTDPGFGPLAIPMEEALERQISFAASENNAVVINDDQLTDLGNAFDFLTTLPDVHPAYITAGQRAALAPLEQARQMKSVSDDPTLADFGLPAEILTLSAASVLGTEAVMGNPLSIIGVAVPLGDEYTLTTDEIGQLLARTAMFNGKLAAVADTYPGLELYDANTFFTGIAAGGGIMADGNFYAPDFSPNGVFSTDGIHPNPVGYALLANEIMDLIEDKFGSELPAYNISEFSTVLTQ